MDRGGPTGERPTAADRWQLVTAKLDPEDVDAVVLLPADFQAQIDRGVEPALELEQMLLTRHPEEIFAAEDEVDWQEWVEFLAERAKPTGVARVLWSLHYDCRY